MACFGITGARAQTWVNQQVASFESLVSNYNVITVGNATFNGTHTDGAVAVGGNLNLNGSDIVLHSNTLNSNPAIYVKGQINLSGSDSKLLSGYAYAPNMNSNPTWVNNGGQRYLQDSNNTKLWFNTTHTSAYTDPRNTPAPTSGFDVTSTTNQLVMVSAALASATATGTISFSNNSITLNTSLTSGTAVFDLDASLIAGLSNTNIQINVPANMVYVINVRNADGTTLFGGGGNNGNAGQNNDKLLWNIIADSNPATSSTVGLGTNFYGSILAPMMDLNNGSQKYVNGQVVANTYTHNGAEVHYVDFTTPVGFTPVPEAGTFGVFGVAGVAAMMFLRRPRRAAANA